MNIIQENSPHIRRKDDLKGMMIDVLIALLPVVVYALVKFTWHAAVNLVLSLATMLAAEFVFVLIKNWGPKDGEKHPFIEKFKFAIKGYSINNLLVPSVSAVIYAMLMPSTESNPAGFIYFEVVIGALFGICIGKLVFGGTGQNIFNPAAVGFIFTKICFVSENTANGYDGIAGATALSGGSQSPLDLFLGNTTGTMGELSKYCILIGLAYLLIRHVADWRVVVSYLGTFLVLTLTAGLVQLVMKNNFDFLAFLLTQLLSGGMLFGVTYMLTDPVTMPITQPSRLLYGMVVAVSTVFIRLFASAPEGMGYSILIGNMLAPVMDHYQWSSSKFNWKNLTAMGAVLVVALGILIWGLSGKLSSSGAIAIFGGF